MNEHSGDFTAPVDMQTHSQISTGSFHSVSFTSTTEGEIIYPHKLISDARTAVGGTLKASPI